MIHRSGELGKRAVLRSDGLFFIRLYPVTRSVSFVACATAF